MRIEAAAGDITDQDVDVVVNTANPGLTGGGGVNAAIHRVGGPSILAETEHLRATTLPDGLALGDAVATGAGDLSARWVVHTLAPDRHAGQTDPELLARCFTRSLEVAAELGATSVAFPAIGAGAYGWDPVEVARVGVEAVRSAPPSSVETVRFVLFSTRALKAIRSAMAATA